jgi:N-acyl homoserine lactone hydrolase
MLSASPAVSRAENGTPEPVRAVSVISTGTVEIHPEHAFGTSKPLYWWLLTSRRWLPPRPINVYVIEHANGLLLFDTGQDRASVTDEAYFPSGLTGVLYDRLARFDIGEQETLTAQLATTTDQVLALKERMPDLAILPAHDPTAAQRLLES